MEHLSFPFQVKAVENDGRFHGYASVFNNEDRQGDVVLPGAFKDTLAKHNGRVPILLAHRTDQPIGFGISAEEDSRGLKVVGEFTMDSDNGRNAYATAKHAAKVQHEIGLSIGYAIRPEGFEYRGDTRYLKAVDLYEYSIALVPANPEARITGVKSDDEILQVLQQLAQRPKAEAEALMKNAGMGRHLRKVALGLLYAHQPDSPFAQVNTKARLRQSLRESEKRDMAIQKYIWDRYQSSHYEAAEKTVGRLGKDWTGPGGERDYLLAVGQERNRTVGLLEEQIIQASKSHEPDDLVECLHRLNWSDEEIRNFFALVKTGEVPVDDPPRRSGFRFPGLGSV